MQNGIFNNIGSTLRDYEGNQQRGLRDLLRQASQAQEQAYTQPMPAPRQMTGVEAIVGALATILGGQQTGQGFLSGLQGGIDTENQRRQQQYEANQRASLARAQGLQQQAGIEQGLLDDFRQASQFNQRQALDRSQANDALAERRRQFGEDQSRQFVQDWIANANKGADREMRRQAEAADADKFNREMQFKAQVEQRMSRAEERAARAQAAKEKADAENRKAMAEYRREMNRLRGMDVQSQIQSRAAGATRGNRQIDPGEAKLQFEKLKEKEKGVASNQKARTGLSGELNGLRSAKSQLEQALVKEMGKERPNQTVLKELRGRIAGYDKTIQEYKSQAPIEPASPFAGGLGVTGEKPTDIAKKSGISLQPPTKGPVSYDTRQMAKDRQEGYDYMRKHPEKAAAIRKRFKDTYGLEL